MCLLRKLQDKLEREHLGCNQLTFVHDWSNYFYVVMCFVLKSNHLKILSLLIKYDVTKFNIFLVENDNNLYQTVSISVPKCYIQSVPYVVLNVYVPGCTNQYGTGCNHV